MAPAASLSLRTVQSICSTSSPTKSKGLGSSAATVTRISPQVNMDKASVKSAIALRPLDFLFGRPRSLGLRPDGTSCSSRHVFTAAVEGSITLEETSAAPVEVSENSDEKSAESTPAAAPLPPAKAERFKPRIPGQKARREDPTVHAEALVEGAVFTGKVTTIQSFGAFVNFGAFTDGLVHISKMSTGYVSNVSDIVALGQEVKVTIINVEQKSGRIALSMVDKEEKEAKDSVAKASEAREGGERSRFQQGPDGRPVNRGRIAGGGRQLKRDEPQKPPTRLSKGQEVEGTVKNKIRSGCFVELPENEEGFLRYSDVPGGENMAPESSLQTGQTIKATVLRIDRGKIVLTMKPPVDITTVNRDINKGEDSGATNPFEIAFRAYNLIPAESASSVEEDVAEVEDAIPELKIAVGEDPVAEEEPVAEIVAPADEDVAKVPASVETAIAETVIPAEEKVVSEAVAPAEEVIAEVVAPTEEELVAEGLAPAGVAEDLAPPEEAVALALASVEDLVADATSAVTEVVSEAAEEAPFIDEVSLETAPRMDRLSEVKESVPERSAAIQEASFAEEVDAKPIPESAVVVEDSPTAVGGAPRKEELVQEAAYDRAKDKAIKEAAASATGVAELVTEKGVGGISAALVKLLRVETGAGMMDCKRALAESGGNIEKARDILRKKGLASAEKKASRIASEGLIGSYIHDCRIGVLVEVNCETDFVSRGPAFKSLVEDIGMQVVASQQVQYVSVDDIPMEVVSKETEMESQREDVLNKPEAMRAKILQGRVSKRLNELALLEQPYIRDDKMLVKDLVKHKVATLGENIKVRRFERYVLGEGLDKKCTNFAAEVAAQTAARAPVKFPKTEEAPALVADTEHKVVVSAALVKQLRDQTGSGMMDCKKALLSTENDLEKAVEFLQMKGLASAEKKASRVASEGVVGTYIHNGRIGILIEVNCETDFVARGQKFKELVEALAMQVAAYPQVEVVCVDDVPVEVVVKERELEFGKDDLASKPEAIRARIVDGRVAKRLSEIALLEQPFIKDDKKVVKDIVKETIASLGENIHIRRFTRFNVGEGIKRKVVDFAAEVAAQTGGRA